MCSIFVSVKNRYFLRRRLLKCVQKASDATTRRPDVSLLLPRSIDVDAITGNYMCLFHESAWETVEITTRIPWHFIKVSFLHIFDQDPTRACEFCPNETN